MWLCECIAVCVSAPLCDVGGAGRDDCKGEGLEGMRCKGEGLEGIKCSVHA